MRFYDKVTLVGLVMLCITNTPRQGATEPQEHDCYSTHDNGSSYTGSQPIVVEVALNPECTSENHCKCELVNSSQFDCLPNPSPTSSLSSTFSVSIPPSSVTASSLTLICSFILPQPITVTIDAPSYSASSTPSSSVSMSKVCSTPSPGIVSTPKTTTTPSSGPPPTSERTSGVSLAAVVGPVTGVVILLLSALVAIISWLVIRRRKRTVILVTSVSTQPSETTPRSAELLYCQVEPKKTATRENMFIIPEPPSHYAGIDHVEMERARKQCVQAETTKKFGNDEAAPVQSSVDPGTVGLSHASHYDLLLSVLLPMKARWFDLGMNLKLSENFLDETETNMESEEECLGEVLQNWLLYHNPTLETLNNALSQMNAPPIAFDAASGEKNL